MKTKYYFTETKNIRKRKKKKVTQEIIRIKLRTIKFNSARFGGFIFLQSRY